MHKVSTTNPVNEPGRVGWRGPGKLGAGFQAFGWRRPGAPCGEALALNPELEPV